MATEKQNTSVLIKAPSRESGSHQESKVLRAVWNSELVSFGSSLHKMYQVTLKNARVHKVAVVMKMPTH